MHRVLKEFVVDKWLSKKIFTAIENKTIEK